MSIHGEKTGTGKAVADLPLGQNAQQRVLKKPGNFYHYSDWHASHYLKMMMDKIFEPKNFQNELVWCYEVGGRGKRRWARKHDTILFYSKGSKFHFDPTAVAERRKPGTHMKVGIDEDGREYQEKRDAKTGKVLWSQDRFGCASIILVDGHLIILAETGDLILAEANAAKYRELARASLLTGPVTTPENSPVLQPCAARSIAAQATSAPSPVGWPGVAA